MPKVAATRGQPFDFEIGKDLSIKLQMYVKNGECKMDLRFDPVKVEMDKNGKETYKAVCNPFFPFLKFGKFIFNICVGGLKCVAHNKNLVGTKARI